MTIFLATITIALATIVIVLAARKRRGNWQGRRRRARRHDALKTDKTFPL